ncbi:MAG: tetratricopeptide repeat protein [Ignavibacteriales bacterium]|nr:tetratricopeptide repeat protein [Ignavibacteriales bacterium]
MNFCPSCGKQLKSDYKFCPACGADLKGGGTSGKSGSLTAPTIGLAIAALLLVVVILWGSGMFDAPEAPKNAATGSQVAPPNSGPNAPARDPAASAAIERRLKELRLATAADPSDAEVALELANALNDAGRYRQAIEGYESYLALEPDNPNAVIDMGVCYFNLAEYDVADSVMRSALKIDPDHQIGYYNLGVVNLSKGDPAEAMRMFERCVEIDPNSEHAKRAKELIESH